MKRLEGIELDGINFNDITYSALYDGENAITWVMLCFPISFSFGMFAMIGYYLFSPAWKEVMRLAENKPQEGPIKEN